MHLQSSSAYLELHVNEEVQFQLSAESDPSPLQIPLRLLWSVSTKVTFQDPSPFSAHTDNMLGTLCTLITALTCVTAVTLVTQRPPVVTVRTGQTVSMDCNLGTVTDIGAWWYKQVPGGVPQHVLRFRLTWSSAPAPESSCPSKSNTATLVWLSSQTGPYADVSWSVGGSSVSSGTSISTAIQQADKTFQISINKMHLQASSAYLELHVNEEVEFQLSEESDPSPLQIPPELSLSGLWSVSTKVIFQDPSPFSAHTDNMLGTLCTLITALTCVTAVTLVTQRPPVVTVRTGQTVSMDCNLGTVANAARWYKQLSGGVPQYVLSAWHNWNTPNYGSGFSAPKFTSSHQSQSDYRLTINNVEEGDSAVYYCSTWDHTVNEWVSQ
ncbi:hypothetical protein Q8A73_002760 [Channa argus]|nr:hypothetical protein Q8A73_002760 [Channa argus]